MSAHGPLLRQEELLAWWLDWMNWLKEKKAEMLGQLRRMEKGKKADEAKEAPLLSFASDAASAADGQTSATFLEIAFGEQAAEKACEAGELVEGFDMQDGQERDEMVPNPEDEAIPEEAALDEVPSEDVLMLEETPRPQDRRMEDLA